MTTAASKSARERLETWVDAAGLASSGSAAPRPVECSTDGPLGAPALAQLQRDIGQYGWALYSAPAHQPRALIAQLCRHFGLGAADRTLTGPADGLVDLCKHPTGAASHYAPYSSRALGWHTDGYYNPAPRTIRAFILHCVRPAARGGANALIDPRRVALRIAQQDMALLLALGEPDVMTIPANVQADAVVRPEVSVPVFAVADDGELVMRFTNRATHIRWRPGALHERAVKVLRDIIEDEDKAATRIILQQGQGLLCNNVLHCREPFADQPAEDKTGAGRLLLRGRYLRRLHVTAHN